MQMAPERMYAEYTVADAILELGLETVGTQTVRTIQARKVRGQAPLLGRHSARIDDEGFASTAVALTIVQAPRFGTFQLELRLALADSAGTVRRVEIGIPAQDTTKLQLPISAPVTSIVLDPEVQLLARLNLRKEP